MLGGTPVLLEAAFAGAAINTAARCRLNCAKAYVWVIAVCLFAGALQVPMVAQDAPVGAAGATSQKAPGLDAEQKQPLIDTTREKWNNFVRETASPLTFGGGAFNAAFSQVTHTDPDYGGNGVGLAERFGASIADIATQNFYGDFVVASALHEDPRYFRMGSGHGFWSRVGYAISRAAVIRSDNGGNTFNFDNLLGSGASTLTSNLYYPPASRTGKAMLMHWGIDVGDNGFVNLAPEFWPDFRDKVLRWKRKHPR